MNILVLLIKNLDELNDLVKQMSTSQKSTELAASSGSKIEVPIVYASIQRSPDIKGFQTNKYLKDLEELLDKKKNLQG